MEKGFTTAWVIGGIVGIGMSAMGVLYASSVRTDASVEVLAGELRGVNSEQDKQIATVIEAVNTIKDSQRRSEADIKEILRAVK